MLEHALRALAQHPEAAGRRRRGRARSAQAAAPRRRARPRARRRRSTSSSAASALARAMLERRCAPLTARDPRRRTPDPHASVDRAHLFLTLRREPGLGEALIAPMLERTFAALAVVSLVAFGGAARAAEGGPAAAPGAALRAAVALEAAGDPAAAAEGFAAVALAAPEVADHASELRIGALQKARRERRDARRSEGVPRALRAGAGCCAGSGRTRRRRTWRKGDEVAARAAWSEAARGLSEGDERARLLAEIARSHERSGETAAAAEGWREIWTRHATSPEAGAAEQALARLAAADAKLVYRTPAALRERCLRLSGALRNEEALVACDAAIAAAPGERGLQRERADVLFRMRRYPEAVDAFRALGDDDRMAVFWRARSLARSGRIEESLATFARVSSGAEPELAARARFLSATLLEDTDLAAAEAAYRSVERTRADGRAALDGELAARLAGVAAGRLRPGGERPRALQRRRGRSRRARARALLARAGLGASRPDAGSRAAGSDRERGALHLLRLARGGASRSGRTGRPRRGVGARGHAPRSPSAAAGDAAAHPDPARGRARRARRGGDPAARAAPRPTPPRASCSRSCCSRRGASIWRSGSSSCATQRP